MKLNVILAVATVLSFAACTGTPAGLANKMDRYLGEPIEYFLDYSGYTPTSERPARDGGTVYEFDDSEMYESVSGVENVHDCRFVVRTDAAGIIRSWESLGDDCRV